MTNVRCHAVFGYDLQESMPVREDDDALSGAGSGVTMTSSLPSPPSEVSQSSETLQPAPSPPPPVTAPAKPSRPEVRYD